MVSLRFAMEIWGLTARMGEDYSSQFVADKISTNVNRYLGKNGSVMEVGCSTNGGFTYDIYVHFEFPPTTEHAIDALMNSCQGLEVMSLYLTNPFSKTSKVHKGVGMETLDMALKQIKDNQDQIKRTVTEGRDFACVYENAMYAV